MAKKKERAFFVCPRWSEVGADLTPAVLGRLTSNRITEKTLAAIKAQQPTARSTLRRALSAAATASGKVLAVDSYIEDQRAMHRAR